LNFSQAAGSSGSRRVEKEPAHELPCDFGSADAVS
jgi:hypothetical protein